MGAPTVVRTWVAAARGGNEPERPRRPNRRREILEAALEEFSLRGFEGANMRRIAVAAGLGSHQNLYWYFPSKLELYRHTLAAFATRTLRKIEAKPPLEELPEVHLSRLARDFLEAFADEDMRKVVQLILNHLRLEAMQIPIEQSRPDNMYARLAHYLRHQVRLGRLRPHDPELSARVFFFQLWSHVNVKYFTRMLAPTPPPDSIFADFVVETFLRGLRPDEPPGSSSARARQT